MERVYDLLYYIIIPAIISVCLAYFLHATNYIDKNEKKKEMYELNGYMDNVCIEETIVCTKTEEKKQAAS